jgi:membrane protein YqaA with SNARE-associated domain
LTEALLEWMLTWADTPYGGVALFAFAFVESIFFPVPPDPLLVALSVTVPTLAIVFAAVTTISSILGGLAGYWVGKKGGRRIVLRVIGEEKTEAVQSLYHKYDVWAVALGGFSPLPYKVFSLSAGAFHLDVKRFIIASLVGRGLRYFTMGFLIFAFGETIQEYILDYAGWVALAVSVAVVVAVVAISQLSQRMTAAN